MKYKVTDPKGILVNGLIVPQGEVIEADGAQRNAWMHFGQIAPHDEEAKTKASEQEEFEESKGASKKSETKAEKK